MHHRVTSLRLRRSALKDQCFTMNCAFNWLESRALDNPLREVGRERTNQLKRFIVQGSLLKIGFFIRIEMIILKVDRHYINGIRRGTK